MRGQGGSGKAVQAPWHWLRDLLWLCSALLCWPALAQDDPPGRVGRIAALEGEVWIFETEQDEWLTAPRNRPITSGDRLATAAAGGATLQIGSTVLYLGPSSELSVMQLDDDAMRFRLEQGSLGLRVRSREAAAELMVANFEGRFTPTAPGLYRIDRLDERSEAEVWRGELRYQSPDVDVALQAGQRARFWQDGQPPATRSIWLTPLDDEFARAVQRDDVPEPRSVAAQFVPPEMTGVDDLDRQGQWQQHPEYGAVWSPAVVSVGWAPYRYGQWVWLRPWGWTWVDDAPWGFAPFHYGRWFWWGSRWCWAPGPMVRRPVFAPALVAWSGGPPRGAGGRPLVGWVPLAPREAYRPAYRASPGHVNRLNPHATLQQPLPPGHGNRAVPGAVTVVPALRARQPVAAAALRDDRLAQQPAWRSEPFSQQAPVRPSWPAREQNGARPSASMGAVPPAVPAQSGAGGTRTRPDPGPPGSTAGLPSGPATGPYFGRPPSTQPMPRHAPPDSGAVATQGASTGAPGTGNNPMATPRTDNAPRRPPGARAEATTGAAAPAATAVAPRPAAAAGGTPAAPIAVTPGTQAPPGGQATTAAKHGAAPHPFRPAAPVATKPVEPVAGTESGSVKGGDAGRDLGERRRTPESRQNPRER